MTTLEILRSQHCTPKKGDADALSRDEIDTNLAVLDGWRLTEDGSGIAKAFRFRDYFHTMAFVNAVASIAHREDHHPDLEVHYDRCVVHYSTHDVGGLSLNDFICAARVEDLGVSAG
ncbi:MAG: 4a-hydroxytetrahydrobiopterin dehydratase [Xanthomonadales bacterium]|nr:4a-hydroxytetrahydrobiopterin dehydratase [Xanthomonadales bacterium]